MNRRKSAVKTRLSRSPLVAISLALGGLIVGACYVVPYLLSPVEADLARDLYHGYRIASGEEWPTIGPRIGNEWHVGPVWYYVLAVALLAFHSVTGAIASIGGMAAFKFPLAWVLGREWIDERLGAAWAILLALPGVSAIESIWVAHPSLVATASLLVVFALWRAVLRHSYAWMCVACLAFGLALHAHPTTLPLGVLLALAFPRIAPPGGRRVSFLVLCGALILLPFAPLVADATGQTQAKAQDFAGFARNVFAALSSFHPASVIPVAANVFWHVPNQVISTYLGDAPLVPAVWKGFLAAMYLVMLVGTALALGRPGLGLRRLAAAALAYTLFCGIVVIAVRDETRFYMAYALTPSIALVQAIGLTACARSGWPGARPAVDVLLGAAIAAFIAVAGARFVQAAQGHVRLPALFGAQMDLKSGPKGGHTELDSLPVWDLDAMGRALCDAGSVRAYGDLAIVVDSQFNVPARVHCGERARVVLGGQPGPDETALYLLPDSELARDSATRRYGAMRLGTVESILYPGKGIALASGIAYPARSECTRSAVGPHRIGFTVAHADTIVVATALPATCPIKMPRVTVDGREVAPTRHLASYFVEAPSSGVETEWKLEIETADIDAVQVFVPGASRSRDR